jgi:chromatin segregation and condensation protein Rec8/ScpA/Scc1 (kleisin family)
LSKSSKDLADTQKEKFEKLTENIEYKDAEDFEKKVSQIKESYFPKKSKAKSDDVVDDVSAIKTDENLNDAMSAYSAAISKTKDIKLSN